jgi:hypothetical protein
MRTEDSNTLSRKAIARLFGPEMNFVAVAAVQDRQLVVAPSSWDGLPVLLRIADGVLERANANLDGLDKLRGVLFAFPRPERAA